MEKLFSISKTAKMTAMTTEALRHYDRIGLVRPCKTDEWTGYRYYSEKEVVRLNTVRALRCMDMPLHEIKEILEIEDFGQIVAFLRQAEQSADKKIAELRDVKARIQRAKRFYESKSTEQTQNSGFFIRRIPQRVIMLAVNLHAPSVDNLYNYHRHFYAQVAADKCDEFAFEDAAGVYETREGANMFAVCSRCAAADGLVTLPAGEYLCAECAEGEREKVSRVLLDLAEERYSVSPEFVLHLIVLTGILQWKYQLQVLVAKD